LSSELAALRDVHLLALSLVLFACFEILPRANQGHNKQHLCASKGSNASPKKEPSYPGTQAFFSGKESG
jgi:hypothetical protein